MYARKHIKIIPTQHGKETLWARLSLRETQTEFAKRFMVGWLTIHRWETGKSKTSGRIHRQILKTILKKLHDEGRLMPHEAFETFYREEINQKEEIQYAGPAHSDSVLVNGS